MQESPLNVRISGNLRKVFRRDHTKAQVELKGLHPLNCKVNQVSARRCQASTVMVKLVRKNGKRDSHRSQQQALGEGTVESF